MASGGYALSQIKDYISSPALYELATMECAAETPEFSFNGFAPSPCAIRSA